MLFVSDDFLEAFGTGIYIGVGGPLLSAEMAFDSMPQDRFLANHAGSILYSANSPFDRPVLDINQP